MSDQNNLFQVKEVDVWLNPNQFSKEIGVTAQAVMKAISSNRFNDNAIRSYQSPSGKAKYKINLLYGKQQWSHQSVVPMNTGDTELSDARREEVLSKAKLARLKADHLDGKLVSISQVQTKIERIAVTFRDTLLNEPTRLAPELAAMEDITEIENRLRERLTEILKDLSNASMC